MAGTGANNSGGSGAGGNSSGVTTANEDGDFGMEESGAAEAEGVFSEFASHLPSTGVLSSREALTRHATAPALQCLYVEVN